MVFSLIHKMCSSSREEPSNQDTRCWDFVTNDSIRDYVCIDTQNLTLQKGKIIKNKLKPRKMQLRIEIGRESRVITLYVKPFPRGGQIQIKSTKFALYYEPARATLSDTFLNGSGPFIGNLRIWKSKATFSISAAFRGGFDIVTAECDLISPQPINTVVAVELAVEAREQTGFCSRYLLLDLAW